MKLQYSTLSLLVPLTLSLFVPQAALGAKTRLFLDVHHLDGVTADAVAEAHEKDLAVEDKHGVHFINYWVDEDSGTVMCLSEAPDANAVLDTHREAHGLVSDEVMEVIQGE